MNDPGPLPRDTPVTLDGAELEQYAEFLRTLLHAAAPVTLAHFRTRMAVADKRAGAGAYDPVTEADRGAEKAIRECIAARYPEHGIFGEEHGYEPGTSPLTWVIDPVDGTRAFITGQLHWGILVALYDGEKPVLGGVHQPFTGEVFLGGRGGAVLERDTTRTALRSRECAELAQATLCCTTPAMFKFPSERRAFDALASRVRLLRYGGDCYSYCMLAHGLVDLVVESDLKPWDVQALIPIVEGAGGVMTDWRGGSAAFGGAVVAAGDARVHRTALEILRGHAATVGTGSA